MADRAVPAPVSDGLPSHPLAHSVVRKRIAARMVESLLHTAPHVTSVFEVDLGAVLAHRERHRPAYAERGIALTLTAYFAQAAVTAIREVPEANSRWTDAALVIYDTVNLGIASAAEEGLVVPVLHGVESLDLSETARRLQDLVQRARAGALTPADVRSGTFTLSNHGVSGSLLAAPIIIPQPQSAILGVGKLEKRAVVIEEAGAERILARPRCYVTLTIDHRVMDGSRANRFLQAFTDRLCGWTD
jgi:2-oxoglutarate dehydrogenase E2 component (dihydrolipoamide succinyltransferase)